MASMNLHECENRKYVDGESAVTTVPAEESSNGKAHSWVRLSWGGMTIAYHFEDAKRMQDMLLAAVTGLDILIEGENPPVDLASLAKSAFACDCDARYAVAKDDTAQSAAPKSTARERAVDFRNRHPISDDRGERAEGCEYCGEVCCACDPCGDTRMDRSNA